MRKYVFSLALVLLFASPALATCIGDCGDDSVAKDGERGESFLINTTYALAPCNQDMCTGLLWTDYRFYWIGGDEVTRRWPGTEYTSTDGTSITSSLWAYKNDPEALDYADEIGAIDDFAQWDWGTETGDVTSTIVLPASRIPNDVTIHGWRFTGNVQLKTATALYNMGDAAGYGFSFWVCQEVDPAGDEWLLAQRPSSGGPDDYINLDATGRFWLNQNSDITTSAAAAFTPSGCETLDDYVHVGITSTAAAGTKIYINGEDETASGGTKNASVWNAGAQNWLTFSGNPSGASNFFHGNIVEFAYFPDVTLLTELSIRQIMACGITGDSDVSIRLAAYAKGVFTEPLSGGALPCGDTK
jgi:hypothetical protein